MQCLGDWFNAARVPNRASAVLAVRIASKRPLASCGLDIFFTGTAAAKAPSFEDGPLLAALFAPPPVAPWEKESLLSPPGPGPWAGAADAAARRDAAEGASELFFSAAKALAHVALFRVCLPSLCFSKPWPCPAAGPAFPRGVDFSTSSFCFAKLTRQADTSCRAFMLASLCMNRFANSFTIFPTCVCVRISTVMCSFSRRFRGTSPSCASKSCRCSSWAQAATSSTPDKGCRFAGCTLLICPDSTSFTSYL
mmetsp:Transcript_28292/g.67289  ORF Transcript_28292/g.67289 Transcript_28292/m.67289 type:complete len:252 (+) Transcript_28292:370-1125(+)